jgi:hypothetical protein
MAIVGFLHPKVVTSGVMKGDMFKLQNAPTIASL